MVGQLVYEKEKNLRTMMKMQARLPSFAAALRAGCSCRQA